MVSKAPVSLQSGGQGQAESNIQMCLERQFVDCFRERTTSQLRSQFTTTNKKLQKRKIKKIKQREQDQEREREAKRQVEQKEKETCQIKLNNQKAVEMLLGSTAKGEPAKTKEEFKELAQTKKANKNRKNRKGKQAPVKENIEVDLT